MARRRNTKTPQSTDVTPSSEEQDNETTNTTTTTSAQNEESVAHNKGETINMSAIDNLEELDDSAIAELLAGTRSTGEYGDYLKEFIASGKVGIEVSFDDPLMVGKDAEKAKIGFENAKKATIKDTDPPQLKVPGANNVKVVKKNTGSKESPVWHLFLINTALASQKAAA